MTRRAKSKKRARARALRDRVPYRAATRDPSTDAHRSASRRQNGSTDLELLVEEALDAWCDEQMAEDLDAIDVDPDEVERDTGIGLVSPTVSELLPETIVSIDPAEEFDGGTRAISFEAEAALSVEGLISKGLAFGLADHQLVTIIDSDHDRHYASVALKGPFRLELEFTAIVDIAGETIHDLELQGAVLQPNR